MKDKPTAIRHPSTQRLYAEAAERLTRLEKQHSAAVNCMRLGMLAANFTDDELALLSHRLCPNDYALLKMIGRKPKGAYRLTDAGVETL